MGIDRSSLVPARTTILIDLIGVVFAAVAGHTTAAQEARTVWDGIYTEEQAERGEAVYEGECTFCHLDDLQGDAFATPLIADAFTLRWEGRTVGDLLTVVKVTMPADRPATLSDEAVAGVVSFLLKMNDYPAGEQELSTDQAELAEVIFTKQEP